MNPRGSHENTLNTKLAQLLRAFGLPAQAEHVQRGSHRQIDVFIETRAAQVAIEAEIDNRRGATNDAAARWSQARDGQISVSNVIAVSYPPGLMESGFDTSTVIEWSVLQPTDSESTTHHSWASGSVWQLTAVIRRCRSAGQFEPSEIASQLDIALDRAVVRLTERQRSDLTLMLQLNQSADQIEVDSEHAFAGAKRALLIVAAAAMFHARLDNHLSKIPPAVDASTGKPFDKSWPPTRLRNCLQGPDYLLVDALLKSWQTILALDYGPIFEAGTRVLLEPAANPQLPAAIRIVVEKSLQVAESASGLGHDLLGSIFHKLVDSARFDGSFYTSTSGAVILAGLAIRAEDLPNNLAEYSLIDPACGTGTLLMAAAERIRDLRERTNSPSDDATVLIEDVITGLDINMTACHMAATTLGLLSPSTTFSRMNIRKMILGPDANDDIRVGSLELLATKPGASRLDLGFSWASGEQIESGNLAEISANSQRLVIMNPPYTRDSLRHDQFSEEIELKLKSREKKLMEGRAGHGSSSGTMFMDLGEHLTSLNGGTLAFVYPAAGAAAPSNELARKLLSEWFHIEWVVASHDPKRTFFSESTNIGEILVVARRRHSDEDADLPTKFLVLTSNPKDTADAASLVTSLENKIVPPSVGRISTWPSELMRKGTWRPLSLTSSYLVELFRQIQTGEIFPSKPFSEISTLGPAGQGVRGAFVKCEFADEKGRRALWHNDTKVTRSMEGQTDTYIHATEKHEGLSDKYWEKRSRLLICVKPRLNTVRVNAVRVERPALGSLWVPARFGASNKKSEGQHQRAYCAYLNSTLGWISMIGVASPKLLSRLDLSMFAMRQIPMPELDERQVGKLARVYEGCKTTEFGLLREANSDTLREKLDRAIAETLGIDVELILTARQELANEPSVQ